MTETPPLSPEDRVLDVCFVGCQGAGQLELIHHCNVYSSSAILKGDEYRVRFVDSSTPSIYDTWHSGILSRADVIFCCFSVVKKHTLEVLEKDWVPKIKVPFILLGVQIDQRKDNSDAFTEADGRNFAEKFGAVGYLEANLKNIDDIVAKSILTADEHWRAQVKSRRDEAAQEPIIRRRDGSEEGDAKAPNELLMYEDERTPFEDDTHPLKREMISANLSVLGLTPAQSHAYLRCDLEDLELTTIDAIRTFTNLQFVNVSKNKLRTLEPLGLLPYLLHINASHNFLERSQTFAPSLQLETCDLSYNSLTQVGDWNIQKYLRELNLRGNLIEYISPGSLSLNMYLRMIDMSENAVKKVENFPPNTETLLLANNHLESLDGIEQYTELQILNVQKNHITHLYPLRVEDCPRLRKLSVSNNNIGSINQLLHLSEFPYLCDLFLIPNPVENLPRYREQVLYRIPNLRYLDESHVLAEEKIKSSELYGDYVSDREEIWHKYLPKEGFVDRRLLTSEMIEKEEQEKFGQVHMVSLDYELPSEWPVQG